jgi:hypothetical protein
MRVDIVKKTLAELQQNQMGVAFVLDQERETGRGYYKDVCFKIFAKNSLNEFLELVDGGCTDWTAKLLSNKKERFFVSGMGSERLIACFGVSTSKALSHSAFVHREDNGL